MLFAYDVYTSRVLEMLSNRTGMDTESAKDLCRTKLPVIHAGYLKTTPAAQIVEKLVETKQISAEN